MISRSKQGLARLWAKRKHGSHISCFPECRKMWRNEPLHSQVSSHFGSWSFDGFPNLQRTILGGQNPLDWSVPYIIGKLLELRCLKWVHMTHLDTSNISYGQKKGRESNWQFDFWPLKVKNRPDFLTCKWYAAHLWKALDKGYNFALDLYWIEDMHTKLSTPKVVGVPNVGILGFRLGSPMTKWHLGAGPMARHRVYYKGEGGGFPQV